MALPPTAAAPLYTANAVIGGGGPIYAGGGAYITGGVTLNIASISHKIGYTINGAVPPEGEEFTLQGKLFVSKFELLDTNYGNHYIVWSKIFGEYFKDYGTVVGNGKGMFPAFGSQETLDHFEQWMTDYDALFFARCGGAATRQYPSLISSEVNGIWIEDRVDRVVADDWIWIVKNYRNPVTRLDKGWLFVNHTDAIHFKMR